MQERFYRTMLLCVNAILCLLFGYGFQNQSKNLLLIGATTTILTLLLIVGHIGAPGFIFVLDFCFSGTHIKSYSHDIDYSADVPIFNRKITTLFKIAVSIILYWGNYQLYSEKYIILILQASLILSAVLYYYVPKNIGAQWAVLTDFYSQSLGYY
jgi:hypothetical protein